MVELLFYTGVAGRLFLQYSFFPIVLDGIDDDGSRDCHHRSSIESPVGRGVGRGFIQCRYLEIIAFVIRWPRKMMIWMRCGVA